MTGLAKAVAERSFDNPPKLPHILQYFAYPEGALAVGGLQAARLFLQLHRKAARLGRARCYGLEQVEIIWPRKSEDWP